MRSRSSRRAHERAQLQEAGQKSRFFNEVMDGLKSRARLRMQRAAEKALPRVSYERLVPALLQEDDDEDDLLSPPPVRTRRTGDEAVDVVERMKAVAEARMHERAKKALPRAHYVRLLNALRADGYGDR